uniref:Uncharacterized protein n=1 Tax=Anguilla anguilla TaxID=7936 RepID=A0A0E9W0R8_ANGAN
MEKTSQTPFLHICVCICYTLLNFINPININMIAAFLFFK